MIAARPVSMWVSMTQLQSLSNMVPQPVYTISYGCYCSSQSPVFSQLKIIAPTGDCFTCTSALSENSCKMICEAWKKRTLFLLLSFKNYVLKKFVHACWWLWSTSCDFWKPNSFSAKVVHALNWWIISPALLLYKAVFSFTRECLYSWIINWELYHMQQYYTIPAKAKRHTYISEYVVYIQTTTSPGKAYHVRQSLALGLICNSDGCLYQMQASGCNDQNMITAVNFAVNTFSSNF